MKQLFLYLLLISSSGALSMDKTPNQNIQLPSQGVLQERFYKNGFFLFVQLSDIDRILANRSLSQHELERIVTAKANTFNQNQMKNHRSDSSDFVPIKKIALIATLLPDYPAHLRLLTQENKELD